MLTGQPLTTRPLATSPITVIVQAIRNVGMLAAKSIRRLMHRKRI